MSKITIDLTKTVKEIITTMKKAIDSLQDQLTFDTTPTAGSSNPVTSGGIKTALDTVSKKADTQADWNSTDSSSIAFIKNIPNSIKSINNSSRFRIKNFNKVDNSGHPTYKIIEELTNYHPKNRPSNWKAYGFSVVALCDIREGNGFNLEPAFMYASLGYEYDMLKSTSSGDFPVVLHNIESDKYYVAIRTTGSYKTVNLIGEFVHPDIELGEEILAQDRNGTPPSGWELTYKPQSMLSMERLQAGRANTATKAIQDASGNVITTTYAKKSEIPSVSVKGVKISGSTSNLTPDTSGIVTIPAIPTKVSTFINDSGYLTTHQDLSGYQTKLTFDSTPTANSSNPVTSAGIKAAIDAKTVDLSNYYTKTQVDSAISNAIASITDGDSNSY